MAPTRSLYLALLLSAFAIADDLTIQTAQGPVQGVALPSGVRQWLGIPFADTTGGPNRWMAPQSAKPFANGTTFKATSFGLSCFQNLNTANEAFLAIINQTAPLQQSEDCLSLNIWAPPTSRQQKTAVMIWIYGGSLEFGTVCCFARKINLPNKMLIEQHRRLQRRELCK